MCGIAGIVSLTGRPLPKQYQRLAYFLMKHGRDRGTHSAGFAGIGTNGKVFEWKSLGDPKDLCEIAPWEMMNEAKSVLIHTRWASRGKICLKNAHPFVDYDSKTILIHNGTIGYHTLANIAKNTKYKGGTLPSSDTLAFFRLYTEYAEKINNRTRALYNIHEMLTKNDESAFAIIYKNRLLLSRNDRPTHVATFAGKYMAFASTEKILRDAITDANAASKKFIKNEAKIVPSLNNVLFTVDLNKRADQTVSWSFEPQKVSYDIDRDLVKRYFGENAETFSYTANWLTEDWYKNYRKSSSGWVSSKTKSEQFTDEDAWGYDAFGNKIDDEYYEGVFEYEKERDMPKGYNTREWKEDDWKKWAAMTGEEKKAWYEGFSKHHNPKKRQKLIDKINRAKRKEMQQALFQNETKKALTVLRKPNGDILRKIKLN